MIWRLKPSLIKSVGEILSDKSAAKFDKTAKLEEYKSVKSIQEIFLVSQTKKEVVVHRRHLSGWNEQMYHGGLVDFQFVGCTISIDEIYHDVEIDDC